MYLFPSNNPFKQNIILFYVAEKLVLTELTGVYTSQQIQWNANTVFLCGATDFTEFANSTALGWLGTASNSTQRTFTNLPPHWSISIRFELILYQSLDPDDSIQVTLNGQTDSYRKDKYWLGYYFCYPNNYYYDEIVLYYKNITTHTSSSLTVLVWGITNESIYNEGFGLKNFYLSVDTCHDSCLSCKGPGADQCLTCPPNSTQDGNTCTCKSGTYSQNNQCVSICPDGYIQDSTGTLCIQSLCYSLVCQTCQKGMCILCQSGYYQLNGQCVQSCPSYTTVSGQKCVDIINQTSHGQYLFKALFSTYFGEGEISGTGLSFLGFQGYLTNPSRAMTTICAGKSLLGGAYLSSINSSINKSFNRLAPHWSVLVGYTLYKIDNWNNESVQMIIDGDIKVTTTRNTTTSNGLSNICGRVSFNDEIIYVSQNFTHSSQNLNLKINSTLSQTAFEQSYGIRELFILVDYCPPNCGACNANGCTKCSDDLFVYNFQCVTECPSNYAPDTSNICQPCDASCLTCSLPQSTTSCQTCKPNTYLNPDNSCQNTCVDNYWPDSTKQICQTCSPTCYNCKSPGDSKSCLSCSGDLYLNNNQCLSTCPPGQYPFKQTNNNICQSCDKNCKTCNGQNSNNCLSCQAPLFYQASSSTCESSCNANQYKNDTNQSCSPCPSNCATCSGPNNNNCLSCSGNLFFYQNQCIPNCPDGFFNDNTNNTCSPCDSTCFTCNGSKQNNCLSCQNKRYFNPLSNQCVYTCNSNQYPDQTSNQCKSCDTSCLTCNGPTSQFCTSCINGLFLENNQCVQKCSQNYYVQPNTNICQQCHNSCLTCSGPSSKECTSCVSSLIFINSQCYSECPNGYYTLQGQQKKECILCNYKCNLGCSGELAEDCDSIKYQYQIIFYILAGKCFIWLISSISGFILDKKQSKVQVEPPRTSVFVGDKQDIQINNFNSPQVENDIQNLQQNGIEEKLSSKSKPESASSQNQQDIINVEKQAHQVQIKLDSDKLKNIGNRRPRQKFHKDPFYDKQIQQFEFQLPSSAFTVNGGQNVKGQNEQAQSISTIPNIQKSGCQIQENQEIKPYVQKYKTAQLLKFALLGNEWVSLFYFYDSNLNRFTRATLILVKYLAFFLSAELLCQKAIYLIAISFIFGWTMKQFFTLFHRSITKMSSKCVQLATFFLITLIAAHITLWFIPQLKSLQMLKDIRWSLLYVIVFVADLIIFQQIFSLFQLILTVKYLNQQFNKVKISKIQFLLANKYFIQKISQIRD
ncbi:zinc finger lsd1 subclass family protein (macronuclear) [Tetrahymena thermophila SB210]|uniref:Zinc finger lsd1 subclass family protein n=1 Tax=Tetrahymena thermophila (strain SB210) TaxID=312017 RepID=Q22Z19_TETTS|nr:zinc finger lsd1 subclass family protein [Tetrahymena thermophila SB210]EAR90502.2 zinc finger lsd1 subclass family protein [Tetrahymena thermophila SB210]|eukprot:XP_001010747.2 zinc finger lsd1 subclass family protein [Tetrahymena thermophila SB210]